MQRLPSRQVLKCHWYVWYCFATCRHAHMHEGRSVCAHCSGGGPAMQGLSHLHPDRARCWHTCLLRDCTCVLRMLVSHTAGASTASTCIGCQAGKYSGAAGTLDQPTYCSRRVLWQATRMVQDQTHRPRAMGDVAICRNDDVAYVSVPC